MPRGKKGPVPEALEDGPPIETIVGQENIVDVDDPGPVPGDEPPVESGYRCDECLFSSNFLSEIQEHCNGTGHGGFKSEEPVQTALFSESGVVYRMINVSLPADFLNEKRERLALLYQSALDVKDEKKSADDDFNARLKHIDSQMQEIARILKTPYTYEKIDCEWRIIEEENARGLYRLDTGELIDKQPLTAEDHAKELEKAEEDNAVPAEP